MIKPAIKVLNESLGSTYYRAVFRLMEFFNKTPRPLQFVNIWIPRIDEVPMSISDYDEEKGELSIIFKVVGEGTRSIRDQKGFFGIKGPLGNGFDPSGYDKILYIAGGTGIAPLPYLARISRLNGVRLDVAWGVRSSDALFNLRELAPGLGEIYYATEDCKMGYCGLVVDLVKEIVNKRTSYDAFIAIGPKEMLRAICKQLSVENDVYVSLEAYVKCGLGACGSCLLRPKPKLLCVDGPVFKCSEIGDHLERY